MLPLLVTNMGDPKNPWDDVPIEVLIEHERKSAKNGIEIDQESKLTPPLTLHLQEMSQLKMMTRKRNIKLS